ncbi:hypothetical protein PTTG_01573 [Puccinia triticina 1-1 BBBD Race 1]|uniref:Uncharacterized protein n=1 Tax=Puccinia triticina (isolate 1-1 / race 1 (BBBD)) TaxID=630390 RepID=A0A180GYX6_PUCT1|nr:hypothetical protein PTTG_01573 [Puccinia triticina 1-1 BBBD Race 1]
MSTRRTTSSNQLLPLTDTEAIIRAANKAKRAAAVAEKQRQATLPIVFPPAPSPSPPQTTLSTSQPATTATQALTPNPLEVHSCPPSLSTSLTLPQAIRFPSSPTTSFFSVDSNVGPIIRAWSPIEPTTIKPPPPPTKPFNPLLSTPPALPPPSQPQPKPTTSPNATFPGPRPSAMSHKERPGTGNEPPTDVSQTSTSGPGPPTDHSFAAQLQSAMLALQQANLDAQQAADARALAAQEAAEERAKADADHFRLAQEAAEEQARANEERLAWFQEALIRATSNQTAPPRPTTPSDGHIDLRRFRTSDGPTYTGPYQETEPFLAWIQGLEIFFDTKKVVATDDKIRIADLSLAKWLSGGLPNEIRADILKFEILEVTPFDYGRFAKRVRIFFDALPVRTLPGRTKGQPITTSTNTAAIPETRAAGTISDELRWCIHSYLDSIGRCHWCRGHCGLPNGTCQNNQARGKVKFPPSFVTPPKPPNYIPPLPLW